MVNFDFQKKKPIEINVCNIILVTDYSNVLEHLPQSLSYLNISETWGENLYLPEKEVYLI